MKCWKGSLWCQEFQDFYIFYGIHCHDMVTIFDHFSSLRRAVERHTVKTKSGAPGLAHSQICLTMHALGKANVKIKDRFLEMRNMEKRGETGKKRRILMAPVGLGHRYHMLSHAITTWMPSVWGFYYRMLKLMMKNAEIWTEFDMAWLLDSLTQYDSVWV